VSVDVGRPNMLAAALGYAGAGIRVHPLNGRTKRPLTDNGFYDASAEREQIERWWTRWPDAAIGCPEFDAVDVDIYKSEAAATWAQIKPLIPKGTPQTLTGGGGYQFLFAPGSLRDGKIGPGVDSRYAGRNYVILPPSLHPSGRRYEWKVQLLGLKQLKPAPDFPHVSGSSSEFQHLREQMDAGEKIRDGRNKAAWWRAVAVLRSLTGTIDLAAVEQLVQAWVNANCAGDLSEVDVPKQVKGAAKFVSSERAKQPPPLDEPEAAPAVEKNPIFVGVTEAKPAVDEPETSDPTATFTEFVARKAETKEALVTSAEGTLLPAGGLVIHVAKTGDGKTTMTVEFVQHAAAGIDYLGLSFPRPLRVLVIENEGPREAFRAKLGVRVEFWKDEGEPRIWDVPAEWGTVRLSDAALRARLREVIRRHHVDLVVSDSLTRFGVRGNGTPEETREFVEWLTELGLGRNVAFWLLHHPRTRSDPGEDELERMAGAWPPHADLILLLKKLPGGRARLSFPKTRWTTSERPPSILSFDAETQSFAYVSDDVVVERDYADEIEALMRAKPDQEWWTVTALRVKKDDGGIGATHENVEQGLRDDRFENVTGDGIGKRKDWTFYRLRPASPGPDDGRDAMTLLPEGREASPSPPIEGVLGGDASLGPLAPRDDDPSDGITFAELAEANRRLTERTGSHKHLLDDSIAEVRRMREEERT
jgi:hypothetical protein